MDTFCGHDDHKISEPKILHGASSFNSFAFAMLNDINSVKFLLATKQLLGDQRFIGHQ